MFRAYLTPPPHHSAFPFPTRLDRRGPESESESEPALRGESEPPPPQGSGRQHPEANLKSEYQETEPKRLYQETTPKQPLRSESSGRFLYPEATPPGSLNSDPEPCPPGGRPRYPYPGSEPSSVGSEAQYPYSGSLGSEPRYPYPGSEPPPPDPSAGYAETEPKYVYQETEPKREAQRAPGSRRFSEATSQRPRCCLLREAGRSQSEETHRLSAAAAAAAAAAATGSATGPPLEDSGLDSDEAGGLSVNSDMRGMQAHVQNSNHVHVGPKVFDQRNFHVARVDSRVDHLVHHETVQTKQENIHTKHEHVQNKTEVHNRTENIRIERIENKHQHIQWNTTEIVHNKGGPIYAEHLVVRCDCKPAGELRADQKLVRTPSTTSLLTFHKLKKYTYICFVTLTHCPSLFVLPIRVPQIWRMLHIIG